jgi:hypothetical protein
VKESGTYIIGPVCIPPRRKARKQLAVMLGEQCLNILASGGYCILEIKAQPLTQVIDSTEHHPEWEACKR